MTTTQQPEYEERDWYNLVPDDAADLVPVVLTRAEIKTLGHVATYAAGVFNVALQVKPELAGRADVQETAISLAAALDIVKNLGKRGN